MPSLPEILEELYAADPTLRHEPALPAIIQQLLAARPDIQVDEAFRLRLQRELTERMHPQNHTSSLITKRSFMPMKWLIALPVVALAAFFIVPKLQPAEAPTTTTVPLTGVSRTTDQAFGTLSKNLVTATAPASREASTSSGSADVQTLTTAAQPVDLIYKPDTSAYTYVYTGTELQLTDASLDVFERRTASDARATNDMLRTLGLGAVDLESFGQMDIQSLSFTQSDGYTISVDAQNGMISLYRNGLHKVLLEDDASQSETITVMPPDAEIISVATTFLQQHGVDVSTYGAPRVVKSSVAPAVGMAERVLLDSKELSIAQYQQSVQVIYPLTVNNSVAYGLWGDSIGMTVDVDVRDRAVNSVYNLTTRRFTSSTYPAVTDATTVLNVAQRGGVYGAIPTDGTKVTEVKLGTPERVLAQMYRYENNTSRDLLVPALRFPVIDPAAGMSTAIVVPLVKDLLEPEVVTIEPLSIDGQGATGSGTPELINGTNPQRD